jgi:hypothetical protein
MDAEAGQKKAESLLEVMMGKGPIGLRAAKKAI